MNAGSPARAAVRALAITSDGRRVIAADGLGRVLEWSAGTTRPRAGVPTDPHDVLAVALAPDAEACLVATTDALLHWVDLETGDIRTSRRFDQPIVALTAGGDGTCVVVLSDGRTVLCPPAAPRQEVAAGGRNPWVAAGCVALSADGTLLAVGDRTGRAFVVRARPPWDPIAVREVPRALVAMALADDGQLVVVDAGGRPLRIDRQGGLTPLWWPDPNAPVLCVAMSARGDRIAMAAGSSVWASGSEGSGPVAVIRAGDWDRYGTGPRVAGKGSDRAAGDEPLDDLRAGSGGTPTVDEDVRFTVYRPDRLTTGRWTPLVVYAHKTDPVPDPEAGVLEPTAEVVRMAARWFDGEPPEPRAVDATAALPRGAGLRVVPDLPGLTCNPQAVELNWLEPVHEIPFRLRAADGLAGCTVRGWVRVWFGRLILGEVSLAIPVDPATAPAGTPGTESAPLAAVRPPEPPRLTHEPIRRYYRIFPSYSHRDTEVVRECRRVAAALGDDYLQDVVALRSGERWSERLLELIDDADVFQLFWSEASMRSVQCRREWEHALGLKRPGFIRPTYWERPIASAPDLDLPPAALRELHFAWLGDPAPPPGAPSLPPAPGPVAPPRSQPSVTAGRYAGAEPPGAPQRAQPSGPAYRAPVLALVALLALLIVVVAVLLALR